MNDNQKTITRRAAILSGAAAFAGLTMVGCADSEKNTNEQISRNDEAERELKEVERKWSEAEMRGDAQAVERILADDFIVTSMGSVGNKKAILATLSNFALKSFDVEDLEARVFGDAGVTTGRSKIVGRYKDQNNDVDVSGSYRFTRMYVKQQDEWRIVAAHVSDGHSSKAGANFKSKFSEEIRH